MALRFCSHAGCAGLNILLYIFTESRPSVIPSDEINCLVLTGMSGKNVVVLIVENAESKVVCLGNID